MTYLRRLAHVLGWSSADVVSGRGAAQSSVAAACEEEVFVVYAAAVEEVFQPSSNPAPSCVCFAMDAHEPPPTGSWLLTAFVSQEGVLSQEAEPLLLLLLLLSHEAEVFFEDRVRLDAFTGAVYR